MREITSHIVNPINDRREEIREREKRENNAARVAAISSGKPVTFIASDGCKVTVTPEGHVFHNMEDWY